ncbi:MAG TPA: energy transducer TonB [Tepidisphaeraceae bacterium]|jgi:TonB family protein|nr:energy transducer TonB [Tepidisphaeraceae bacterium]
MELRLVASSVAEPALAPEPSTGRWQGGAGPAGQHATLLQVFTLVVALVCQGIGWMGLALRYPWPHPPPPEPPPVQAQLINVDISDQAPAPPDAAPPDQPAPAPAPEPDVPPLPALPQPSPAVAFAVPTDVPPSPIAPKAIAPVPVAPAPPAAPQVRRITYGQGEGRQPAPQYPAQAVNERQEGAVLVRFTVGEDGRVLTAQVASPCRWPLLNQAALSAVRDLWHFPSGPTRLYEVSIRFKLNQL